MNSFSFSLSEKLSQMVRVSVAIGSKKSPQRYQQQEMKYRQAFKVCS